MKLPLLISLPHAGLSVPPPLKPLCVLTPEQIKKDGDEGAAEIYAIRDEVAEFVTTDVARAILDMNRAEDDRRPDGIVKTHTCWNEPVYNDSLPDELVATLLDEFYRPYHAQLSAAASRDLLLGVDCHTMASHGPPIGPDPGVERPWVCLSNADDTCPLEWIESLAECFRCEFEGPVTINNPFRGGYIIRSHAAEMPWLQPRIYSRGPRGRQDGPN